MSSRLISAVIEIEAHVAEGGWDQPVRMFALAAADELVAAEPGLAEAMGVEPSDSSWVPIEQEWPDDGEPLDEVLLEIGWPDEVRGCVVVLERMVLPPAAEAELVADGLDPQSFEFGTRAAEHPDRRDVRMTIGVERDGARACRLRVQQADGEETFTDGPDLVPGLSRALMATFED
jgi:hypothetical protein